MSMVLRALLFLTSAGMLVFVLYQIRRARTQIEGAVFWILFVAGLVAVSLFPGAVIYLSGIIGVESPANFVFLCIIFLLTLKVFQVSLQLSKTQYQLQQLAQTAALRDAGREDAR